MTEKPIREVLGAGQAAVRDVTSSQTAPPADETHTRAQRPDPEQLALRQEQIRRQTTWRDLVRAAGGSLGRATFDGYRIDGTAETRRNQSTVLAHVREWAETFPDRQRAGEGLLLYGPVGTGKDHLMISACRILIRDHGATVTWANGRDIMGTLRDEIDGGRPEAVVSRLAAPAVLVISDPLPPIGQLTVYQADMLYRIVRARTDAGRITCTTVNVETDKEGDDRLGCPTWDRLRQGAWMMHCAWPSHRKPARSYP